MITLIMKVSQAALERGIGSEARSMEGVWNVPTCGPGDGRGGVHFETASHALQPGERNGLLNVLCGLWHDLFVPHHIVAKSMG